MKPSNRRKARSLALQALYQWQLTADHPEDIGKQFATKLNPKKVDGDYFYDLLNGVINNVYTLDHNIAPLLDRKISALDLVELAILRLASYELIFRIDVPYKVIINESLELAKDFGSITGYKYINGVLDNLAKDVRKT